VREKRPALGRGSQVAEKERLCLQNKLPVGGGVAKHMIAIEPQELHVGAGFLQGIVERLGLNEWDHLVSRAVDDQNRRIRFRDVRDRRGVAPHVRMLGQVGT
jgi:hypothetical protein